MFSFFLLHNICAKSTDYIFPHIAIFFPTVTGKLLQTLKINQRELIYAAPKWKYHSQLGNNNKMLQSVSLNATERASVPATGALSYFTGWIFISRISIIVTFGPFRHF